MMCIIIIDDVCHLICETESTMPNPTILVTGATGKTGSAVAAQLLEQGWPVRALVRAESNTSQRLQKLGAEVVVADPYDVEQLTQAMRGTTRAYYLPPFDPFMIQGATAFAVAAQAAQLEGIVQMSQWLSSPAHPSLATRQIWLVEQLFSRLAGIAHTVINPGFFADNHLRLIGFAAHLGVYPNLNGDSRNAPPSNEDIARVATSILVNPGAHAGKTYRPTGPALLAADDIVATLSHVLKRPVRRVDLPWWMFERAARIQGLSPFELSGIRHYIEDHRQGAFAFGAPNEDVLEVTGRAPESFETTTRRYAAHAQAQPTLINRWRTLSEFLRVPFTRGYNYDAYDRGLGFPMPSTPKLAMDDAQWRANHGGKTTDSPNQATASTTGVAARQF